MTTMTRCWFVAGAVFLCGPVVAQDQKPPEQHAVPLAPQMVLDDFRAAYRKGVLAEEVLVTVRPSAGATRSDRVTIRVDAAGVRSDDGPRSVLLELGPLRIWLGDGRAIATHQGEPGLYFERELPASWDAAVLPPLPLPQLAALAPDADAMNTPTPFTPGVQWTAGVLDPAATPPVATATGISDGGSVSLVIEGETGRLVKFTATTTSPAGGVELELTCAPVDPGDPASWRPVTAGLEQVASLAELRTGRAPPPLQVGHPVPDITLLGPDLTAWSLHDALRSAAAGAAAPAPPAIIILFRATPQSPSRADAQAALEAVRRLIAPTAGEPALLVARSAAVIELGDFSRDGFQQLRQQWGPADPARSIPADDLLWASSPAQTIDRLSRDAAAVAAVIGPDRLLRGVLILDGRGADAEALAGELRALLELPP